VRICLASIHPRMLSGQIEGLIALRTGLEKRGHAVEVVSAFQPGQLEQDRRWDREYGDSRGLLPRVGRIAGLIGNVASAARRADVLHFNLPTPAFGSVADAVGTAARVPTVVGFEAHLADVPATARRLGAAVPFYAPRIMINNGVVARLTAHRAATYVVSSEYQRSELTALGYPRDRVAVIPNLIDRAKLQRWDRAEARRALELPDDPLVAFLGHFHDVKGHDVLIEAFVAVRREVPEARLALAWSGIGSRYEVRAAIARAGIADRVIELGRLDVGQLFSAADVVALPYRFSIGQAAYPGTLLEAMAVGVPLVTSTLPLLEELTDCGRTALLARPGDVEDLATQIVRLLREPALGAELVAAQRAAMAERFDEAKLIDRYIEVYGRAIA
jgi:glycosyltransferase involved in cell wall biosynthesis